MDGTEVEFKTLAKKPGKHYDDEIEYELHDYAESVCYLPVSQITMIEPSIKLKGCTWVYMEDGNNFALREPYASVKEKCDEAVKKAALFYLTKQKT